MAALVQKYITVSCNSVNTAVLSGKKKVKYCKKLWQAPFWQFSFDA